MGNRNRTKKLFDDAEEFFEYRYHPNPSTYLIAKNDENFYSKIDISPDNDGKILLENYTKNYLYFLQTRIKEDDVYDWDEDYPESGILIKSFDSLERDFYRDKNSFEEIDNDDFLQQQYQLRYFNLELPLNDTQSIHLHQYISSSYKSSLEKALIKIRPNENTERIKVIDFTNSFTLNNDFDFVGFYDKKNIGNCFTIISNLKPFERLHGIIEKYKEAYDEVSKLDCLDLSNLTDTEDCWRKCASLLKFKERARCMAALKVDLLSKSTNFPKKFLDEKGIKFDIIDGQPVLTPENPKQLKIIIKILSDKLVKTHLRHKDGLSDRIEEFST